jgi:hypothetical protein
VVAADDAASALVELDALRPRRDAAVITTVPAEVNAAGVASAPDALVTATPIDPDPVGQPTDNSS